MFDEYFAYFGLTGGVLLIIGVGLLLFLLIAIILERRTSCSFPNARSPRRNLMTIFCPLTMTRMTSESTGTLSPTRT